MQINPQSQPQLPQDSLGVYRERVESLKKAYEIQIKAIRMGKGDINGVLKSASTLYKDLNKAHLNYRDLSEADFGVSRVRNMGDLPARVEQKKELESLIEATIDISTKAREILKAGALKPESGEVIKKTEKLAKDFKSNPRHLGELLLQINLISTPTRYGNEFQDFAKKIKELESYRNLYPLSKEDQEKLDSIIRELKNGVNKRLDYFKKILDEEFSKTPGFVEGINDTSVKTEDAEGILSKNQDSYLLRFDERNQLMLSYIDRDKFVHKPVRYDSATNSYYMHIIGKNGKSIAAKTISKLMEQVEKSTHLSPLLTEKEIDKNDAEKILKNKPDRSYLLRKEVDEDRHTISYKSGKTITHIPIVKEEGGLYQAWAVINGKKKEFVSRTINRLHQNVAKSLDLTQVFESRPPPLPSRDLPKK